jgi:hypothetical protein
MDIDRPSHVDARGCDASGVVGPCGESHSGIVVLHVALSSALRGPRILMLPYQESWLARVKKCLMPIHVCELCEVILLNCDGCTHGVGGPE